MRRPSASSRCSIISALIAASSCRATHMSTTIVLSSTRWRDFQNACVASPLPTRGSRPRSCAIGTRAACGLRFHLFPRRPNYVRGVGLDVFEVFRKTIAELGWVVQFFCEHTMLAPTAATLHEISGQMPVIVDHLGMVPAGQGVNDPNFQALLKFVGDGHAYVKLSAIYRLSTQFPDYADAKPLHDALVAANQERLMWGTDWPHPSIPAEVIPDDGHLLDLFHAWTPDEQTRQRILVDTPARLFGR
jgi:predicted TIM-barrel fold metal-dependent hydrolase